MTNQPPLNPDGIEAAENVFIFMCADGYTPKAEDAAESLVSAYLAAAQPEVNSVEELDALPPYSYVQGWDGFKHAKDWNGGWHLIVNRPSGAPHLSGSIELPARVLYRPVVES
ncbi:MULTISPECIES: hypothetical protein [unclassified Glutamicibacter]|uniref:hypothetical protein n=1 Tax=unclassified Glutamicibacter TaxID=2627139 RepID=UPI003828FE69